MDKVLYIERFFQREFLPDRSTWRYAQSDRDKANLVARAIETNSKLSVDLKFNFFNYLLEMPLGEYNALLTHFPMGQKPENREDKMEFYRQTYKHSIQTLSQFRKAHPDFPIVVYTGASSGEEMDPSSVPVKTIITESGADAIVFKRNPEKDGLIIGEKLIELIESKGITS